MAVEFSVTEDLLVIFPIGEIDHHESKEMRSEIDLRIEESRPSNIVFDLSRTTFMDSSGLGLILGRYKLAQRIGSDFFVANPGEKIMRILCMAGVDKIIKIKGVEK